MKSKNRQFTIELQHAKKLDFQLTETELLQVTEAIRKDKRPEVRQRTTTIWPQALGKTRLSG